MSDNMKKGMSMVEILVVIGLTSMLLIGAMSMLSSAIRVQSETLARQSMIDQASYVLDIMTKELRMARKDFISTSSIPAHSQGKRPSHPPPNRRIAPWRREFRRQIVHRVLAARGEVTSRRRPASQVAEQFRQGPGRGHVKFRRRDFAKRKW